MKRFFRLFLILLFCCNTTALTAQDEYDIVKLKEKISGQKNWFELLPASIQDKNKTEVQVRNIYNEMYKDNMKLKKGNNISKAITFILFFVIGIIIGLRIKRFPKISVSKKIPILLLTILVSNIIYSQDQEYVKREFERQSELSKNYEWAIAAREKEMGFIQTRINEYIKDIDREKQKSYELEEDKFYSAKNILLTIAIFLIGISVGRLIKKLKTYSIKIG